MSNLTYENFGHLVSNPASFKKASPISLTNSDTGIEQAERTNEQESKTFFWAGINRLSAALEKTIVNPNQAWMVYK